MTNDRSQIPITYLSQPAPVSMGDEWFDVATPGHFWIRRRFDVLCRLLRRAALQVTGKSVAEIGCGHGLVQRQLFDRFHAAVDGFELNETALQKSVATDQPRIVYDIFSKRREYADHYDVLFAFDVLEHIDDDRGFLEAIAFHVRDGGAIVINVPAMQWLFSSYDDAAGHVRRYDMKTLRELCNACGLSVTIASYWGFPYIPLLILRTMLLGRLFGKRSVIESGFKPPSKAGNAVLYWLGHLEYIPNRLVGTSLMVIARKEGHRR